MARHTVAFKRGSARGAPPDVYMPFGTFDDDGNDEAILDVMGWCKGMASAAIWFVVIIVFLIVWVACDDPNT